MRSAPIPEHLGTTFGIRAATEGGLTASRLRRRDLERPVRGVRRTASAADLRAEDAITALALAHADGLGPHAFFGSITAAVLWRLPLPWAALGIGTLDVCVHTPRRNPRGAGIRGHETAPHLLHVMTHPTLGVRVASPASTWAMLAPMLHDPYDLVAVGDAIMRTPQHPRDPPALGTIAQLASAVGAGRRVGVQRLREALPRVRDGASSRTETWTRLVLLDGGLPEPVLAHQVFDARGRFVARVDLAYPELRIAIEYEGEHHFRDPDQWRADIARYERLAEEGWRVIRVTRDELFDDADALVARVRRALVAD